MMNRIAQIDRETTETKVRLILNLDGAGKASINTNVPFLTHMLELFTKHGLFDLTVDATGDVHIDAHHTVEDIGICLGQAFREAIGDAAGICRYASGLIPMDEALCRSHPPSAYPPQPPLWTLGSAPLFRRRSLIPAGRAASEIHPSFPLWMGGR